MLDNSNQFNSGPMQEDSGSKPKESTGDSIETSGEAQSKYHSSDEKPIPQQAESQVPQNPSFDEYLEIHYQLTKFQQKPLIRIAGWIDRHIPENGWINRFLHNLLASLSILKNQGLKALFHRIEYKNKIAGRRNKIWNKVNLNSLINNEYYELTPDLSEAFLRQATSNPPDRPDIIIFSFIDWEFRIQRPQHLATHLAGSGHRVFYIQANFSKGKSLLVNRVIDKVFLVKFPQGNTPIQFNSTLSKDHVFYIRSLISKIIEAFNIHTAIIKVDLPIWQQLAIQLSDEFGWKLVYDCMDEHAGFSHTGQVAIKDELILLSKSDLVLFSSNVLQNKYKDTNEKSLLLPNGTDFELFHQAAQVINSDLNNQFRHPVIGYYGAIADWFDTQLVRKLASTHPEWTFVLIGSTELAHLKPLYGLSNIHLLGEKPYEKLPEFLSVFDVCIIPFIRNSLTNATDPVKLYEFLSAGKPVVASHLDEISKYGEYIHTAGTLDEWERAIQDSLVEEKTEALLAFRFEFARTNTWKMRAEILVSEFARLFPKISIIVVTYNNLEYTKLCLESIVKCTEYPAYEIILVDNASQDGTVEYLEEYKRIHKNISLIKNNRNLGFAAANNLGVNASTADTLVFLNNDTLVTPGWLHRLFYHLNKNPGTGMVGPVTNGIGNEAKIDIDYTQLSDINYFAAMRADQYSGSSFEIRVLALYCAMISRTLYNQLGGLDERYQVGMFEDDDLALKIQHAGFNLLCAEDVFIHHFHKISFNQFTDQEFHRIFQENKIKFEQKWGITWQPHQERPRNP